MAFDPYTEVEQASPPFPSHPLLSPNRPTKEKEGFRSQTSELNAFPTLHARSTSTSGPTRDVGYYPLSLCMLILWIVYVVILLWLLETAVKHGPESISQPWAYTTLPSLLITVFAQGHGAITAMHLSRVSVSALHSVRTSPSTWAEVFWISDRAWQGPVGIATTFFAASRLRIRTSTHFILCALTCLTALVTPIILSRAYPIQTITVNENTQITPFALSPKQMGAVDAYAEMGTGSGSWTTALSVADTYNSSIFLPPAASRDGDPADFFFAGNVEGTTARLPGLRLSGQCVPVQSPVSSFEDFANYSIAQIPSASPGGQTRVPALTVNPASSVNLTFTSFCNATWGVLLPADQATGTNVGYIYLQSTNGSSSVNGVIRCDTRFATGRATLSGTTGTFTDFTEEALYHDTQGGEPLLDPLYSMLYYFNDRQLFESAQMKAGVARALGYVPLVQDGGNPGYTQPTIDEMATGFWRGVSYNVAGLGLLSRSNEVTYPAVQSGQTAVHVRERRFASGAYALLALWLLLLIFITARSFRPTFAGSFDSYITAKLVQNKPGLVEESSGDLAANENVKESFGVAGSDGNGRIVVR